MSRLGGVASLLDGFNAGYEKTGRALRNIEITKLNREKPVEDTGFTQAQGDQLRAAAESGQYDVTWDAERGQYAVAPKAAPEMVGNVAPQARTTYLGKTYDTAPSADELTAAKQLATAGIMEKYGDVAGGQALRERIAQQGLAQERADRERALAPLQLEQAQLGVGAARRQADRTARADSADAQAGEFLKKRLANPDGSVRPAEMDDHMAALQYRAGKLFEGGDSEAGMQALQQYNAAAAGKIALETGQRNEALGRVMAALAAGDLQPVKDFYNRFVPDGAKVTAVERGKGGAITIHRETSDGRALPPTTMQDAGQLSAALNSFRDPDAVYKWSQAEFNKNMALRQDARANASLGLQQANFAAGASQRQLSDTTAKLQMERLDKNTSPERRAEIDALLSSGRHGGGEMPADVKMAQVALQAGMFSDMKSALTWATRNQDASPEKRKADIYGKALATLGSHEAAKSVTESAMQYLYPDGDPASPRSSGARGAPMSFNSSADVEKAASEGKVKKGDRVIVNGRPATWQ